MTTFTSAEQLLLELTNRARMDPQGEVTRVAQDLNVPFTDLNQFIAANESGYPITPTPKQVLAGNNILEGVAAAHSNAMAIAQNPVHSGLSRQLRQRPRDSHRRRALLAKPAQLLS